MEPEYAYVAHEVAPPELGIYQVKMLSHTRLEGLEERVNKWLSARDSWILRVSSVTHSKDDSFHYATILYSEHKD